MRFATLIQIAGAAALASVPVMASAAPLRAGAALPQTSTVNLAVAQRAGTPGDHQSDLRGVPVLGFVGIFVAVIVIVVVATRHGNRSPG